MNFKSFAPPHRIQRFTVLIFILSFLSCIILFILLHDYFFDLSISIVKSLEIERKRDDLFYQFFSFIETYICSDYVTYFILLLMYNYGNIFKSFILFVEIVLSKYFTGLFRLVFQQTPPYYDHSVPFSVINEHKFSFPSEKLILLPVFYMTLWEIAVKKLSGKEQSDYKYFMLFGVIAIVGILLISEVVLGMVSIDQGFFSIWISMDLYYMIFHVLKLNFSDNKHFYRIIRSNIKKIFAIVVFLLSIPLIIYLIRKDSEYIKSLENQITDMNKSDNEILFDKEALSTSFVLFCVVFMFIGFKLELNFLFQEQFSNWSQYNFEPNDENNHSYSTGSYNSSLSERISITRGAQWNHTKFVKSIFRFIAIVILVVLCFSPYFFIKWSSSLFIVILIKDMLCWSMAALGGTFFFKVLLKYFNLSNSTLWTILRESI